MDYALIALIISGLALVANLGTAIFGSGRGLSDRFAKTDASIAALREEIHEKQDRSENSVGDALRAMREHTHSIEKAALESRAIAAETYMRRDSYYKASEELKRDVNVGFERVEKRLERMESKFDHKEPK